MIELSCDLNAPEPIGKRITIRRYEARDKEAIWILSQKALSAEGIQQTKDPKRHYDFNYIEEVYLKPGGEFLVGEIDGRIVAMGGFKIKPGEVTVGITRMRVDPEYQRQGAGQCILHELETRAIESGYKKARLGTATNLRWASSFYEKNGYRLISETPMRGTSYSSRIYEKDLINNSN